MFKKIVLMALLAVSYGRAYGAFASSSMQEEVTTRSYESYEEEKPLIREKVIKAIFEGEKDPFSATMVVRCESEFNPNPRFNTSRIYYVFRGNLLAMDPYDFECISSGNFFHIARFTRSGESWIDAIVVGNNRHHDEDGVRKAMAGIILAQAKKSANEKSLHEPGAKQ